jgi:hypothetical protein
MADKLKFDLSPVADQSRILTVPEGFDHLEGVEPGVRYVITGTRQHMRLVRDERPLRYSEDK